MAAVDILGGLFIPRYRWNDGNVGLGNIGTVNADGEEVAMIIQIPKTGNIDAVEWRVGTTTTAGDLDVRLEGVDLTNGLPDGTLIAANAEGTHAVQAADDNTWLRTPLDASIAVTQGDYVAVVLVRPASGTIVINFPEQSDDAWESAFPGTIDNTGGKDDNAPMIGLEYDDGSYPQIIGCVPFAYASESWDSADTPDERALRFSIPFAARMAGFWTEVAYQSTTLSVIDFVLYNAADAVLFTLTPDREVNQSEGGRPPRFYRLTSGIDLDANTVYRLAVKPTTNGASWTIRDVLAAASMELADGGTEFYLSTRTDGGSWTDTTTTRPPLGIYLDQIDSAPTGGTASNPVSLLGGRTGGKQ